MKKIHPDGSHLYRHRCEAPLRHIFFIFIHKVDIFLPVGKDLESLSECV